MKDIYVIFAFHAHELMWDLPEIMLSYLHEENPMKNSILDENYLQRREQEKRDIYTQCVEFAEQFDVPVCLEFSNELLSQLSNLMPNSYQNLKKGYEKGRLYPIYGHAHHTHTSLLNIEELAQEIQFNMQFLHNYMGVPYPRCSGLFSTEASYSFHKMEGVAKANIQYVIFPHLNRDKHPFTVRGEGDYKYKPFILETGSKNILAIPRNFPISQEIWRPITKMKREEVKFQGYMLGTYPVFQNEYLHDETEEYPISMDEGVEMYKEVIRKELKEAPNNGILLYIQDLELMDFGETALEILKRAWGEILPEVQDSYRIHFVTPDDYIEEILNTENTAQMPRVKFEDTTWAPEIRLVLRPDGHYPPLGVEMGKTYKIEKTGLYRYPHAFWENGKYYCGIFDTMLRNFNIYPNIAVHASYLHNIKYDLHMESYDVQAVMYSRLMKRACNWGWRPTEGRQKLPYLKGFLLCEILLDKLKSFSLDELLFRDNIKPIEGRNIVGLAETLKVFLDNRIDYLQHGFNIITEQGGNVDFSSLREELAAATGWRNRAVGKAIKFYEINRESELTREKLEESINVLKEYSLAVYMATDYLQKIWGLSPDTELMVEKMYEYLYELYPPMFPYILDNIDSMEEEDVKEYFSALKGETYV